MRDRAQRGAGAALNEDLTEAIGLGHDLGHPPFGHIGEAVLDERLTDRYGVRFRHNHHSLRTVERLERDGQGLNLTEQVRDGILRHTGPEHPATLEGKIVRVVDRIAYINHDIDDALRAGVIAEDDLPAAEIDVLGPTGSDRIETLVNDLLERSAGAGDIVQGEDVGGAMLRLRKFMFERVYLGPSAQSERDRIERMLRALFDHYAADPPPSPDPDASEHERVVDYLAGMTDRYAIRAFSDLSVPQGFYGGALHPGLDRAPARGDRHRRAGALSAPTCASAARAGWGCARSTRSARRRSPSTLARSSTTASAATRAATRSPSCARPRRWTSPRPWSSSATATGWSSSASARILRRRSAAGAASACSACSTGQRASTPPTCGTPPRRARRATTCPERGLSEEVLRAFRVGYAPSAWDRLLTGARRDGFTEQELYAAGLAQRSQGGRVFDRFRERITFPLADSRGRVLGFGARAMRSEQGAKYLNTSEGELYHKGRHLFGIDQARPAISRERRAVVVEGYTDVLALHQAGVQEAVAIMGTAFTGDQLAELARAVGQEGRIFLALDADSSGQEAMLRVARMAEERQLELRVVELPEGSDPADLAAAEGREGVGARLEKALSVLEFAVGRVLADADRDSPEGRDRALAQARSLIAQAPERSARRDHLVGLVADGLDVPADYVTSGARRGRAAPRRSRPARRPGRGSGARARAGSSAR